MDVTDLVRRLVRRRVALLVVVLVAVGVAAAGWATAGISRQSGAAVVIVPPPLGSAVSDQNPLLNLDNNLAQLATVLAAALESSTVSHELDQVGATASFTVSTVTGDNPSFAQLSPQMIFTVTGNSDSVAKLTSTQLVAQAREQLTALQDRANVPTAARASIVEVVPPTGGEPVGGGRLRSAGSLGLAVVVLGAVVILLVDEMLGRRGIRRSRRHAAVAVRPARVPTPAPKPGATKAVPTPAPEEVAAVPPHPTSVPG